MGNNNEINSAHIYTRNNKRAVNTYKFSMINKIKLVI